MTHETINRERAIELFHELMQPDSEFRILRLLGEAKQGKTHLLTKLFPSLARQVYQARHAILDLGSHGLTIPDILHNVCALLGDRRQFSAFYAAHQQWMNRPQVSVSQLRALLSLVQIRSEGQMDESQKIHRHLLSQFIIDLRNLNEEPLLLLIDAVNDATENVQSWLMGSLLVQLSALTHVRVIVGGRSVPEACGSYAAICQSYNLPSVEEEEAYITFCRQIGVSLEEQSIRDFAFYCDYRPGLFADFVVPKSGHREVARV